LSTERRQNR